MVTDSYIIYVYERVLIGQTRFKTIFDVSLNEKRRIGGVMMRYAYEHLLHWNADYALMYTNKKIEKAFLFNEIYKKMEIERPTGAYFNFKSILQYVFPESMRYDIEDEAIDEYKRVMRLDEYALSPGEKRTPKPKFQKNFFANYDGRVRATTILNYMISRFIGNISTYDLYHTFGDRQRATKFLADNGIKGGNFPGFNTPLELLHEALSEDDRSDVFYINEYLTAKLWPERYLDESLEKKRRK